SEFFNGDTYDNWQQYMQQYVVTDATAALAQDPRTVLDVGRLPGAPWQSDTDHQSIYVQVDWDINEELKLTTEARWVDERFSISRPNQSSCSNLAIGYAFNDGSGTTSLPLGGSWVIEGSGNPIPPFVSVTPDLNCSSVNRIATFDTWRVIEGFEEDDFIVPKATLEWFWAEDKMVYFSWAKAQKPGGINQLAAGGSAVEIDDLRFDAEKMTTWELGTKSSWELAGSLTANAAIFYNDYTDKQVSTQVLDENGSLQPRVLNASSADVLGVELDMTWLPSAIDGLLIRAAYTWQEGEYNDFFDRSSSAIRAGFLDQCAVVTIDTPGGTEERCEFDLSGNALERQARNAFSASFNYTRPFGDSAMDWFIEGDTSYTDKRFVDQDNFVFFDDYWLTNFRLGLQGDTWDALIFVDNAFDDDTIRSGGSGPEFTLQSTRLGFTAGLGVNGYFGILPDPRIVGLRTNFRFGN
ncbi:MAG: TonB-dependent receptor, partial [Gammaproteobacteria bacterium]|nr:TonB-dependent receptor [Gammaproteobacteria bacterium]